MNAILTFPAKDEYLGDYAHRLCRTAISHNRPVRGEWLGVQLLARPGDIYQCVVGQYLMLTECRVERWGLQSRRAK